MRADQLLVQRGLAASRSQAQRLLDGGARWLSREGWRALKKSDDLPDDAQLELANADEAKYVSRGGLKLEAALREACVDVQGQLCLDIGQSTGGFTDCLLQHGAAEVWGVDVGRDQLHAKLRADARVRCVEGIHARDALFNTIQEIATIYIATNPMNVLGYSPFFMKKGSLTVIDVSFISQTLLLPQIQKCLAAGAPILALVKPQFELQPQDLGKGGLVKDESLYERVHNRVTEAYAAHGFDVLRYFNSPIAGGDGNREFFIHAVRNEKT
jgi:23S rRNA (cytidine1920-2'-O)/16S rRNA (cytidine1409-2'-O)-methyltransferase